MAYKYRVGYIYEQAYSFTDERGAKREGKTTHCVLHTLNDYGEIKKTFDYKVAPQFAAYISTGFCGSPAFDSFGRLADFFDDKEGE